MTDDEGTEDASRAEREQHGQPAETPGEARRRLALAHINLIMNGGGNQSDIDLDYLATVLAEAQATANVRAEYAAFRAKAVKVALREATRRGWCEEIYNVLRQAGFSDEELPLTHVKVRVTREFDVRLRRIDDLGSIDANSVERAVLDHLRSYDLREGEYEVLTRPRNEAV